MGKNADLRKRIYFTLFILLIFIVGTTIPVPGTQGAISNLGIWELYDAIGGGALQNFSIFALAITEEKFLKEFARRVAGVVNGAVC